MSTTTKTFVLFGKQYRTKQFAAVPALALMERRAELHPRDLLSNCEVADGDGVWRNLGNDDAINDLVFDAIEIIPPRMVLNALISISNDLNFNFLIGWKGVKVPARFLDGAKTVTSKNVDPLISQLLQEGVPLRELEEYYSLEDAFKMFDVLMVKGVNTALSNEAASKETKRR